jgi:hypothetical protein
LQSALQEHTNQCLALDPTKYEKDLKKTKTLMVRARAFGFGRTFMAFRAKVGHICQRELHCELQNFNCFSFVRFACFLGNVTLITDTYFLLLADD